MDVVSSANKTTTFSDTFENTTNEVTVMNLTLREYDIG